MRVTTAGIDPANWRPKPRRKAAPKPRPDRTGVHLTPRERDILRELLLGKSNKEIGAALGVAEGTIKIYFGKLYAKTPSDNNRVGLALWAERMAASRDSRTAGAAHIAAVMRLEDQLD